MPAGFFASFPAGGGGGGGVTSLNSQIGALTLVAGSNITITPGSGTFTIDATASGANTSLSNLTSTAINQNLQFAAGIAGNILTVDQAITILAGNGGPSSSPVQIQTGPSTGWNSSDISLSSGAASGGQSGNLVLTTGQSDSSNTGGFSFTSGDSATNDSGGFSITMGAAPSGTRGKIVFADGTQGTSGHVWTSTDANGSGSWAPAGSSGANTALSNLSSTAVNTSIIPGSNNSMDLGSSGSSWATAYIQTLVSNSGFLELSGGLSGTVQVDSTMTFLADKQLKLTRALVAGNTPPLVFNAAGSPDFGWSFHFDPNVYGDFYISSNNSNDVERFFIDFTTGHIRMAAYGAGASVFDSSGNISSVAPGSSGNVLTSNGSTWTSAAPAGGGVTTMQTFGSTPNANGASISGVNLTLQPANGSNPGGVSTTTQTFAGAKTFSTSVISPIFSSNTVNPASVGSIRLANQDAIVWRNAGNSGDKALYIDGNDNLLLSGGVALVLAGSSTGQLRQKAAASTTTYTVLWPAAQGAASTVLKNDGSGNLSWTDPGAASAEAALGTLTWAAGAAPSGTISKTYRAAISGSQVTVVCKITASVAGTAVTGVTFPLPAGLPTPATWATQESSGLVVPGAGSMTAALGNAASGACGLYENGSGGYNVQIYDVGALSANNAYASFTYYSA